MQDPNDLLATSDENDLLSESAQPETVKKSFVGNILDNLTNKSTRPTGLLGGAGVLLSASGHREESVLPAVTSVLGAFLGSRVGHPNLGAGFGATGGELAKQSIGKYFRGDEKEIDPAGAIISGGLTAAGSKVLETGLKVGGVAKNLIPEQSRADFFKNTLRAVNVGHKQLVRNWGKAVNKIVADNPNTRVSLQEPMKAIKANLEGMDQTILPQVRSALSRNPKLAQMVKDPSKAIGLTLKEAQELKTAVTSTTKSIIERGAKGMTTPAERSVFKILDQFDDKIVDQFPAMREVKRAYRLGKESYDMVRPLVQPGTSVESSIMSQPRSFYGLGGTKFMGSTQGKLAFKQITGMTKPGAKMAQAAEYAHELNRVADFVGRVGQLAVGGALYKKLTGKDKE